MPPATQGCQACLAYLCRFVVVLLCDGIFLSLSEPPQGVCALHLLCLPSKRSCSEEIFLGCCRVSAFKEHVQTPLLCVEMARILVPCGKLIARRRKRCGLATLGHYCWTVCAHNAIAVSCLTVLAFW